MNFSKREKRFLIVGGVTVLIIIAVKFLIFPVIDRGEFMEETIAAKKRLYTDYQESLAQRPQMELRLEALKESIKRLEASLLKGKTATLASAELQSILEKMAKDRGSKIKSVKTFKAEDLGDYSKVWVEITLTSDIRSLLNLLYDIESHNMVPSVAQMDVHLQGTKGNQTLRTILKLEGGLKNNGTLSIVEKS